MRFLPFIVASLYVTSAFAGPNDFYSDLFVPGKKSAVRSKAEFRKYSKESMAGDRFSLEQSRLEASAPIYSAEEFNWRATAFAEYDDIESSARFPDGRIMPNRLWDLGVGIGHNRELAEGKSVSGNLSLSSPSEKPFSAGRDMGITLNLSYKLPQADENAWIFFLGFSNNRGFLNYVPLPGVAYFYRASSQLRMVLGLPFAMLFWLPGENWTVSAYYFPIRSAELRVAYGKPRGVQPFALVAYRTRNYRLSDRSSENERLFFDEGFSQAGVNFPVYRGVLLELSGGLSFDRRYYLAEKSTSRSKAPGLKADNAFFGSARLQTFF